MNKDTTVVKFRSSMKELVGECIYAISSLKRLSKMEVDFFASLELHYSGLIMCSIDELIEQEEIEAELKPATKGYFFIRQKNSFLFVPGELYIGFTQAQLISSAEESLNGLSITHQIHKTNEGIHVRVKI